MTSKIHIKKGILSLLLLFCFSVVPGQEIELKVSDTPLNQVLVGLRDRYDLQVSFNDQLLSTFRVTGTRVFSSPEKTFDFLLQDLPLKYEKMGKVYVFYSYQPEIHGKRWLLAGQFQDWQSHEALPYTHVQINGHGVVTDQKGCFSFVSAVDSLFRLRASYLGYYVLDTIVSYGSSHRFKLIPSRIKIKEVKVLGASVNRSLQAGYSPGVLRLNHQVSGFIPGYGDNSVFNLLRLQPGILAAGEQSNDLIIWGSYEGQSQVLFDGIALFGMKNFNDNISAVNPFLAKDIQVFKGGFGAEHGERVGGLVNISGIDGTPDTTHVKLSINNMTLNGMVSLPVARQASLVIALRQTYYGLYDPETFAGSGKGSGNGNGTQNGYTIYPDYHFHDLNLKFSGKRNNGDSYSLSWLYGKDHFSYSIFRERAKATVRNASDEENKQAGISALYGKLWANGNRSNLTMAWSGLRKKVEELSEVKRSAGRQQGLYSFGEDNTNEVSEFSGKLENYLSFAEGHSLHVGLGLYRNTVKFEQDSLQVRTAFSHETAYRWMGFVQDEVSFGKTIRLKAGLRADYPASIGKVYLQPRVSATLNLTEFFKVNGAWGLYNQFVVRSSVVDELDNYRYRWTIADNNGIPVLDAEHWVGGLTYHQNNLTLSAEGYYKHTSGLTRFVQEQDGGGAVSQGDSRSKGVDFFIQKEYRGHLFWVAYSLSRTEERFSYFTGEEYRRALHDQRHEVKCAAILDLKPFFISAAYVYGSGFPDPGSLDQENVFEYPYKRLDVSVVYRFGFRKFRLESGISVLNVFNTENIKYADFVRIPEEQDITLNIQAGAIPFTPNLFLNFSF
jgi:hypothetical protein